MDKLPNLLLIAGTGNKSGKTTLACRIIEQFRDTGIAGIKITPHFHETTPGLVLISEGEGFSVFKETDPATEKDTSRMLRAGASRVYFIKVTDGNLKEAFSGVLKYIGSGIPVVCESPALRHYYEPGMFIIMNSDSAFNPKNLSSLLRFPNVLIHLEELKQLNQLPLMFKEGRWQGI